jgi:hypothetical protein
MDGCGVNRSAGFRWDRQWVVVNSKGRAYTQRVEPKLALVEVEMPPEAFAEEWRPTVDSYLGILAFSLYYLIIYYQFCMCHLLIYFS